MRYQGEADFRHDSAECTGVLVVNLGTPDAPTAAAVRRYLAEFLGDPRVIELPRPLWWLILHGVVLRIRPSRSARAYAGIWREEGSPLLLHTRALADGLQRELDGRFGGPVRVEVGMTYGNPSIPDALERLRAAGARRLLVLPLYPQYSGTTTASVFDRVAGTLGRWRWVPELRFINAYHDDPGYIAALAGRVRAHWAERGRGERLLFSFHGIPRRYLLAGDPYHCQCHKTARLVADALELDPQHWHLSFQSRVGREEWLRPYTDESLEAWGREGVGDIDVICPGFASDCLETLEEIEEENAERLREAGGGELRYVPALNAGADHVALLADLVGRHAAGWPEAAGDFDADRRRAEGRAARDRALAMGAER